MTDLLFYLGTIAMGTVGITFGVLAKTGHWRAWAPRYFAEDLPSYLRNGPFALIPAGMFFLAMAGIGAVEPLAVWAPLPFMILMLASGATVVLFCLDPPDELKPDWLLAEERGEVEPPPDRKSYLEVSPFEYKASVVAIFAVIVAWVVFDLPVSILIPVGLAISLLAATRRRRT